LLQNYQKEREHFTDLLLHIITWIIMFGQT